MPIATMTSENGLTSFATEGRPFFRAAPLFGEPQNRSNLLFSRNSKTENRFALSQELLEESTLQYLMIRGSSVAETSSALW